MMPLIRVLLLTGVALTGEFGILSLSPVHLAYAAEISRAEICTQTSAPESLRDAFQLVCQHPTPKLSDLVGRDTIVIGFVGGFVSATDTNHPEVQFATYLHSSYPDLVHAEVFANHSGKKALRSVLSLLDHNHDGVLSDTEKGQARIILYGHSWGASQAVTLARQLDSRGIPVLMTIQIDSIAKPFHRRPGIPGNVRNAVNFYQDRGLLHGNARIWAVDSAHTRIIGNFHMNYRGRHINCDNYPWIVRHLNRPHHEIENDPEVWDRIASLIDSLLLNKPLEPQRSMR